MQLFFYFFRISLKLDWHFFTVSIIIIIISAFTHWLCTRTLYDFNRTYLIQTMYIQHSAHHYCDKENLRYFFWQLTYDIFVFNYIDFCFYRSQSVHVQRNLVKKNRIVVENIILIIFDKSSDWNVLYIHCYISYNDRVYNCRKKSCGWD